MSSSNLDLENLTNEEISIKILINDIYKLEEQIKIIQKYELDNSRNEGGNYSKLDELKNNKNNLKQKINDINNNFELDSSKILNEINFKKNIINESDIKLNEYKNKLKSFNITNFKSISMTKYILSNTLNDFLTQEQIDDILYVSQNQNNSDEIQRILKEIEINKASENVIINNINILKEKLNNINEILNMSKEDRVSTSEELINLISCKESLESIIKYISLNLTKYNLSNCYNVQNIDLKSSNLLNLNEKNEIEIYIYEILILDFNLISIKLCEEVFEIFDLNNGGGNDLTKFNETNKSKISSNNNKLNTPFINKTTKSVINIPHSNKSEDKYIESLDMTNNTFNKKDFDKDKKSFIIIVQKEINNLKKINKNNKNKITINTFLDNLSVLLINKLQSYDIIVPSENIVLYLTFFFKILYYDNIIDKYYNFINKEYKIIKKEQKKSIELINNELSKLEIKQEEINTKKLLNEEEFKYLSKNNCNNENLSPIEKDYIQICSKANELIKKCEMLNKEIYNEEKNLNEKKFINKNEINSINNEIFKIEQKIEEIKNNINKKKYKDNEEIINYRKIISEKYNLIQMQLQLYKNKYGSNLSIYDNILEDINNKIINNSSEIQSKLNKSQTYSRYPSNFTENLNNYSLINNEIKNKLGYSVSNKFPSNNNDNIGIITTVNDINNNRNNNIYDLLLNNESGKKNINKKNRLGKKFNKSSSTPNSKNININNNNTALFSSNNKIKQNTNMIKLFKNLNKNANNDINSLNNKIMLNNNSNNSSSNVNNKKSINDKNNTFTNFYKKKKNKSSSVEECLNNKNLKININGLNILGINKVNADKKEKLNFFRNKKIEVSKGNNNDNNKLKLNKLWSNENISKNIQKIVSKKVNNKNNISKILLQEGYITKLKPLTKITFCYYREIYKNSNLNKYNPLILYDLPPNDLCEHPYNFIKSTISLNKSYDTIKIIPSNQIDSIDLKINQIENTVVNSAVKVIIDIHREYNKYKESKDYFSMEEFIKNIKKNYSNLSDENIEKCALNKNFNFSLLVNKGRRIEFIICSYDDFKLWINGMAFIIKNKREILNLILGNNIIKK